MRDYNLNIVCYTCNNFVHQIDMICSNQYTCMSNMDILGWDVCDDFVELFVMLYSPIGMYNQASP